MMVFDKSGCRAYCGDVDWGLNFLSIEVDGEIHKIPVVNPWGSSLLAL